MNLCDFVVLAMKTWLGADCVQTKEHHHPGTKDLSGVVAVRTWSQRSKLFFVSLSDCNHAIVNSLPVNSWHDTLDVLAARTPHWPHNVVTSANTHVPLPVLADMSAVHLPDAECDKHLIAFDLVRRP